jgi:hypothetical protein
MGGRNATKRTASGGKGARTRARDAGPTTKAGLYRRAKKQHVPNRSKRSKRQLVNALRSGTR